MKSDLLKIINHYTLMKQLKYIHSEYFELDEAILEYQTYSNHFDDLDYGIGAYDWTRKREHIGEEIADIMVMLKQFQYYYDISDEQIEDIMKFKIKRQLERIETEGKEG